MEAIDLTIKPSRYGSTELYDLIQQDAVMLLESYGISVSEVTAQKILAALATDQQEKLIYSSDTDRFYLTSEVIDETLAQIRQGIDFWPKGFGTGGMAAYIVDESGPRSSVPDDIAALARIYGETEILTSLQSSCNVCNRVKKSDMTTRARLECEVIDSMINNAGGKLITPTILSTEAYDLLASYHEKGHPVGSALSITSTYMTVSDEMVDPFLKNAQRGLPYIMNSMPIGGLTGPYSMSSLATLAQAEALFGLVLGQLVHPGIKGINAAMPTIADLRSKEMPMMFGSVANTMLNILLAELNMHLGIPTCQSACSHHRDLLDTEARVRVKEIYRLVKHHNFHILRHLFGFSSQLNDFSLENMKIQLEIFAEVMDDPTPPPEIAPAEYDEGGMEALFEGFERRDFRVLDHTLSNIGKSFAS